MPHVASYKKPPLVEQFAELYLEKGTLPAEKVIKFVPEIQQLGLNQVEMGVIEEVLINIGPVAAASNLVQQGQKPRIRCWNSSKSKLAQLFEDRVTIHQVGQYLGWDEFKALFESVLTASKNKISGFSAESIAFQTIDKFKVGSAGFEVGKFINCDGSIVPRWYADVRESADITLGKGLLSERGYNRQIGITIKVAQEQTEVTIRSTFHDALKRGEDIQARLEKLHDESNESFEKLITPFFRANIMEGEKNK